MGDPAIQQAHDVLEEPSADPEVRLLVQHREQSQQAYRLAMSAALDNGRSEALGHARAAVLEICELVGITPTDEQRAELDRLGGAGIDALTARLVEDRRWA